MPVARPWVLRKFEARLDVAAVKNHSMVRKTVR